MAWGEEGVTSCGEVHTPEELDKLAGRRQCEEDNYANPRRHFPPVIHKPQLSSTSSWTQSEAIVSGSFVASYFNSDNNTNTNTTATTNNNNK